MTAPADLAGMRFGRLVAIEPFIGPSVSRRSWLCKCDCGGSAIVQTSNLRGGNSQSCGCLHNEQLTERSTKHGLCRTRAYASWVGAQQRCMNPENSGYKHYGARGIRFCERWQGPDGLANFIADMGERPRGTSLDRIDVNGHYEPSNCRWASARTQARNKRTSKLEEHEYDQIRWLASEGYSRLEIARFFDITRTHVGYVLNMEHP